MFELKLAGAAAGTMACAALCASMAVSPAMAQTYGEARLAPGFSPNPLLVDLVAGGPAEAERFGTSCVGHVAEAPDFALDWAGGSDLSIVVVSDADTTLVVIGPDGQVWCDDDSGGDVNPGVRLNGAPAGRYQIWVGSYAAENAAARLWIGEGAL